MSAWAAIRYVRDEVPRMTETVDGKVRPLVDSSARLVAYVIATHADTRTGRSVVGLRRLANLTGLHTATVQRALGRLEAVGVLAIEHRGAGKRHAYRFPVAEKLSTAARTTRALSESTGARVTRAGCAHDARTLAKEGWLNEGVSQADDPRGRFLPGTGWVPKYGG